MDISNLRKEFIEAFDITDEVVLDALDVALLDGWLVEKDLEMHENKFWERIIPSNYQYETWLVDGRLYKV